MNNATIACIGAGNMGRSLIGGLIANGLPAQQMRVYEPDEQQRASLAQFGPVVTAASANEAIDGADLVILAVKPQVIHDVCNDIADSCRRNRSVVVSIAAGIRTGSLQRWLGDDVAIVRVMPNTPAMLGAGASALFATAGVNQDGRNLAERVVRAVGLAEWLDDEDLMDTVTALSGSGPAYFFLLMEAMEKAATAQGLNAGSARLLTIETALGAARMALESDDDPGTLRQRVTSPGGTTEAALQVFNDGGLPALVGKALDAARQRSQQLAAQLGAD